MQVITKRFTFSYGHILPGHAGKCKNLHGHNAVVYVSVRGAPSLVEGAPDEGMVMDFGDLKKIFKEHIDDPWDHHFLANGDEIVNGQLVNPLLEDNAIVGVRTTAENLAKIVYNTIEQALKERNSDAAIYEVVFYETEDSYAKYSGW